MNTETIRKTDNAFRSIEENKEVILDSEFFNIISHKTAKGIDYEIVLRINYYCNLNCIFCFINHSDPVDEEIIQYVIKKIKETNKLRNINVSISGGEPTINPKFLEYIKDLYNHVNRIYVQTNAIKLKDDEFINTLLPYSDKIVFFIGLLSFNKDVYTKLSGKDESKYYEFIKAIDNIKKNRFKVVFNIVLNKKSVRSVENDIRVIAENMPTAEVMVSRINICPEVDEKYDLTLDFNEYIKAVERIKKYNVNVRLTEGGGCGIPLCILKEFGEINSRSYENKNLIQWVNNKEEKLTKNFIKVKGYCDKCKFSKYCQGIDVTYFIKYGFNLKKYYLKNAKEAKLTKNL